ncbi:MAG: Cation transporter [Clostridium sp.]
MSKASIYFQLEHPEDKRNCKEIKRRLDSVPGVISVSVSRGRETVAVDYDTTGTNPNQLRKELDGCGCTVANEQVQNHTM